MQRDGLMPSEGKANDRAARRLGISTRTLKRLLALALAATHRPPRMHMGRVADRTSGTTGRRIAGLARGRVTFFDFDFLSFFVLLRARKVST